MPALIGTKHSLRYKPLEYELYAPFIGADQGYANGQVLETRAEGVRKGNLTVVEVDGTLALSGNKCAFTAQATAVWGDLGLYSQAITRELGKVLVATLNLTTWEEIGMGWDDAAAVADPDNMVYALQANATDGQLDLQGGTAIATGLSTSSDIALCIVLGGYSASGVPYYAGQPVSDYLYGAAYYGKGTGLGDGTEWVLLWRSASDNTATLYAALSSLDAVGTID